MILCLTGMPGSGKTTAAEIFARRGFEVVEGSAVIKEEMRKRGIAVNPKSVEIFAKRMKAEHGKDVFANMTGKLMKKMLDDRNILFVGARSISELEAIERAVGIKLKLIALTTPQKTRFKRLSERKVLGIKSPDVLLLKDRSNIDMGMLELVKRANYLVSNTGSRKELEESINELIGLIGDEE
jgi:dephospho-CoA kinase